MTLATVAREHYEQQRRLAAQVAAAAQAWWSQLDRGDLTGSWQAGIGASVLRAVVAGQLLAAGGADRYVDAALAEQDADPDRQGSVVGRAFAGIASDGRPLGTLLYEPIIATKAYLAQGRPFDEAFRGGRARLVRIASTQVADADRAATATAMTARPRVAGYVRVTRSSPCARCAILAGRFYRWSDGFERHPVCGCRNVPAADRDAQGVAADPRAYFDGLPAEDQDRLFTADGAQAIRDGADVARVVNTGRRGGITDNTARVRGQRRRTPEQITTAADDRRTAVTELRAAGYLTR